MLSRQMEQRAVLLSGENMSRKLLGLGFLAGFVALLIVATVIAQEEQEGRRSARTLFSSPWKAMQRLVGRGEDKEEPATANGNTAGAAPVASPQYIHRNRTSQVRAEHHPSSEPSNVHIERPTGSGQAVAGPEDLEGTLDALEAIRQGRRPTTGARRHPQQRAGSATGQRSVYSARRLDTNTQTPAAPAQPPAGESQQPHLLEYDASPLSAARTPLPPQESQTSEQNVYEAITSPRMPTATPHHDPRSTAPQHGPATNDPQTSRKPRQDGPYRETIRRPSQWHHPAAQRTARVDRPTAQPDVPEADASDLVTGIALPSLRIETRGPAAVDIGQRAIYRVTVVNSGNGQEDGVRVRVPIPAGVEFVDAVAEFGEVKREEGENDAFLVWTMDRVAANSRKSLNLTLQPKQPEPFQLNVVWQLSPQSSASSVRVRQPKLQLQIEGPDQLHYGEDGLLTLQVTNAGDGLAEDAALQISIGETDKKPLQIGNIAAGETKKATIEISPIEAGQLNIRVAAGAKNAVSVSDTASLLVKRPNLVVTMAGPAELEFGQAEIFTVVLANDGNADAENVKLQATLEGNVTERLFEGSVPAGGEKKIQFELTPRKAGDMWIEATAQASRGLSAKDRHNMKIRQARLDLKLDGPKLAFAGMPATFQVQVKNEGDATARGLHGTFHLPAGATYVSGLEAFVSDADVPAEGQLQFNIGDLLPGEQRTLDVQCKLIDSGSKNLRAVIQGAGKISASQTAVTEVKAVANLGLSISDPQGPVPVGQKIVYAIKLQNRGATSARDLDLTVELAEDVKITRVMGLPATTGQSRVVFQKIHHLGPGETLEVQLEAEAAAQGNHRYRVAVSCAQPQANLASEGTTFCYSVD